MKYIRQLLEIREDNTCIAIEAIAQNIKICGHLLGIKAGGFASVLVSVV